MAQLFEYQNSQNKDKTQGRVQHYSRAPPQKHYNNPRASHHSGGFSGSGPKQYITKQCTPVGRCR